MGPGIPTTFAHMLGCFVLGSPQNLHSVFDCRGWPSQHRQDPSLGLLIVLIPSIWAKRRRRGNIPGPGSHWTLVQFPPQQSMVELTTGATPEDLLINFPVYYKCVDCRAHVTAGAVGSGTW
jgi:hypothetical protein